MKLFIAESYANHTMIEIVSGIVGPFQKPITAELFKEAHTIESSDAVLVPHDAHYFHKYPEYLDYLNQISRRKLIIFSDRGDFPKKPTLNNSIALRVAINPGEKLNNKIVIPYNVETLSTLPLRKYSKNPDISFVGFMPKASLGRIYKSALQSPLHVLAGNSAVVRNLAHSKMKRTELNYRFSLRDTYGALNVQPNDLSRIQYLESISDSDMVLTPRGDANQSARFYEVLSSGRIPIVPDSYIELPKVFKSSDLPIIHFPLLIGAKDLDFMIQYNWTNILNNENYIRLQRNLRTFFTRNLVFDKFIKNLLNLNIEEFRSMALSN